MNDLAPLRAFQRSLTQSNLPAASECLERDPSLAVWLRDAPSDTGKPALAFARTPEVVDWLVRHGASTRRLAEWAAPGFGLDTIPTAVGAHLAWMGTRWSPHAAAALGLLDVLGNLLETDPSLVHSKGGDGARPLHFSRTTEIARFLVDCGAELDPRDDDHDSTPAQWRIGDAPDVTRFLHGAGAAPDLFMAAGLGDLDLARSIVRSDPTTTHHRIGDHRGPFPGIGFKGRGGTIYQWTLGFNLTPHEVAFRRGHIELFEWLIAQTPPRQAFLVACTMADRPRAERLAREHPGMVQSLPPEDLQLPAKFCWETNTNVEAVRLMLDLGFPVGIPEHNHGYSPLHNAAFCGSEELVRLLLERGHPVDDPDPRFQSTPLGFALYSVRAGRRDERGNYVEVARRLMDAGAKVPANSVPTGDPGLDAVIRAGRGH